MHQFLRAIGFSDTFSSEYELNLLLDNIASTYDQRVSVKEGPGVRTFLEMSKTFGPSMGLKVCGELDGHRFSRMYYYPYLSGNTVSSEENLCIDRRTDGYSYSAMLEDGRVGVSLIFFVQNPAEIRKRQLAESVSGMGITTSLCGLSTSGTILLPIHSGGEQKKEEHEQYYQRHDNLVTAAKNGSQEAIEALTYEDMDLYAMLSRRIMREDVYSIVETSFMPYGMESDQYQLIGKIKFYTKVRNTLTMESVYQMTLECNGIELDVCINEKDLLGQPEPGRRFKGNIWLQGQINLPKTV